MALQTHILRVALVLPIFAAMSMIAEPGALIDQPAAAAADRSNLEAQQTDIYLKGSFSENLYPVALNGAKTGALAGMGIGALLGAQVGSAMGQGCAILFCRGRTETVIDRVIPLAAIITGAVHGGLFGAVAGAATGAVIGAIVNPLLIRPLYLLLYGKEEQKKRKMQQITDAETVK